MTPDEAGEVLAVAATFDERDVTIPAARSWALALTQAGITYDEAMAAVPMHYALSAERVWPADLARIALDIRAEEYRRTKARERKLKHAPYPDGITWSDVREGRAELPEGCEPPPPLGPTRDRSEDLVRLISGMKMTNADGTPSTRLRDDPEMLHDLLEHYRIAPDGHERWSLIGDRSMRRKQGGSVNPTARAAAEEASRAKARAIVAEARAERAGRPVGTDPADSDPL